MAATELGPSAEAPTLECHLLPCAIGHDGPAPVSSYFRPQSTGASVDGVEVLSCGFRGRALAGGVVPLPEGYSGVVLQCEHSEPGSSQEEGGHGGSGGGGSYRWAVAGRFSELGCWNHDAAPTKGDGPRRLLDWAALAAQLHRPVAPAQVQQQQQQHQQQRQQMGQEEAQPVPA